MNKTNDKKKCKFDIVSTDTQSDLKKYMLTDTCENQNLYFF